MSVRHTTWLKVFRADAVSKQNGKCKYCKCPITAKTATADHAWPRAPGPSELIASDTTEQKKAA